SAGSQLAGAFGLLDHRQTDPVLDATARIELLELCQLGRSDAARDLLQTHHRRVSDEVEDAVGKLHVPKRILGSARSSRCSSPNQLKNTARPQTAMVSLPRTIRTAPATVWSMIGVIVGSSRGTCV